MRLTYRKVPKISPGTVYFSKALFEGLIFGGAYIRRGLSTEGNLRFKIDWAAASLINESKFTIFSLFYFVFEGNFRVQAPQGAYIWRGNLTQGFSRYEFGGLIYLEGLIFGILRYFISNVLSGSFTSHISNSSSFVLQPVNSWVM